MNLLYYAIPAKANHGGFSPVCLDAQAGGSDGLSDFFSYFIGAELLTLRQYTGAMIIIFAMIFVEAGSYHRSRSIDS